MLISPAHAIAQALVLIRNIGCRLKLQGSRTSPNIALTLCYHSTKIILSPRAQGILLASAVYGCSTIIKCKSTKIFSYLYIIRCIFKTILTEKRFLSWEPPPAPTPLSPQSGARGVPTGCLYATDEHGRSSFAKEIPSQSVFVRGIKNLGKRDNFAWRC